MSGSRTRPRRKASRSTARRADQPAQKFGGFSMAIYQPGVPVRMGTSFTDYAQDGYSKCATAYSCINQIGSGVGSIHWLAFKSGGKKRTELPDHPALKLLNRPNPMMSRKTFFEAIETYLGIAGECYVLASRAGGGKGIPLELWLLRPDLLDVIPGARGIPLRYEYGPTGQKIRYEVDPITGRSNVLPIRYFNPLNPWRGLTRLSAAALQVDTLNSTDRSNLALVQNSGRPSGAFFMKVDENNPGRLQPEQRAEFRKYIDERFSGPENAGRPMVIEHGFDWKQIQLSPLDMDYLNSKKVSKAEICSVFRVPAQCLNIEGSQTFANYEQARLALYEDCILPETDLLRDELNNWLMPMFGEGAELDYDEDRISALSPRRKEKYEQIKGSTWLTLNEQREAMKNTPYIPSDNPADTIFVQSGLIPIEMAAESLDLEPVDDTESEDPESGSESDPVEVEPAKQLPPPEAKSSRAARRSEWRRQERKRWGFERKMRTQLRAVFKAEGAAVAKAVEGLQDPELAELAITRVLTATSPAFQKVYELSISATGEAFGKDVLDLVKGKCAGVTFEMKDAESRFTNFMNLLLGRIPARVQKMAGVTRKVVMKAIRDDIRAARAEGVEVDFKKATARAYAGFSLSRSKTISRTETHQAAQEASRGAARALAIPTLRKEWVSAHDDRTRDSHVKADGQMVGLEEKFTVGTEHMDGPGDPNADASELINCRCATTYSVQE